MDCSIGTDTSVLKSSLKEKKKKWVSCKIPFIRYGTTIKTNKILTTFIPVYRNA